MGFLDSIMRGLRLIRLDATAAVEIAQDTGSTVYGWIIIIVAALLFALLPYVPPYVIPFDAKVFLITIVGYVIFAASSILIFHGLAKLFGGQSRLLEYIRAQYHVLLLNWLLVFNIIGIPFNTLLWLIAIWNIVVTIVIIKSLHKLNTWRAIIVTLLLPVISVVLSLVIGALASFRYIKF